VRRFFDNGLGDIGLLIKGDLLPKLTVRKASLQTTPLSYGGLDLSDEKFSMLRSQSIESKLQKLWIRLFGKIDVKQPESR
jgi:hypothetical protein